MPKQSHTIFSVLRRGGRLCPPAPDSATLCRAGPACPAGEVGKKNPPVTASPCPAPFRQGGRGDGGDGLPRARCALAMTEAERICVSFRASAHTGVGIRFSWKAGRERSAVLPRPGGLNLYHAFHGKHEAPWCLAAKNHPTAIGSRVKRSHNSFGPGTGSGPGAAYCVSDLAE